MVHKVNQVRQVQEVELFHRFRGRRVNALTCKKDVAKILLFHIDIHIAHWHWQWQVSTNPKQLELYFVTAWIINVERHLQDALHVSQT